MYIYYVQALMGDLHVAILGCTASSYEALENEHPIKAIVEAIPAIVLQSVVSTEVALAISQKVFKRLYEKSDSQLMIDIHIAILAHIHDVCKSVGKELTNWVIYSDDEVRTADMLLHLVFS